MKLPKRRRKECKTDYKLRLGLLKYGKPRLVIRKTNKYIIAQIVTSEEAQDRVVCGITSKKLTESGWPKEKKGSLKNLAAAYLTGFIIGKMAMKKEIDNLIVDIGLYRSIPKSRIYSVVKGAKDAGVNVLCDESVFPSGEQITRNGEFEDIINKIKEKIQ